MVTAALSLKDVIAVAILLSFYAFSVTAIMYVFFLREKPRTRVGRRHDRHDEH